MKARLLSVLLIFAFCLGAAAQTTEQEWQREAVRRYPTLGVAGTPLNKAFLTEYQRRKQNPAEAAFFANPRWPMLLAEECARQVAAGSGPAAGSRPVSPTNPLMPGSSIWPGLPIRPGSLPGNFPAFSNPASSIGLVAIIAVVLIAVLIGLCIGTVLVQLATRIVAGFTPPFGMACVAIILSVIVSIVGRIVINALLGAASGGHMTLGLSAFVLLITLLLQAAIYGSVLKDSAVPIGTGKGCLVGLVQTLLAIVFGVAIIGISILAGASLPAFSQFHR